MSTSSTSEEPTTTEPGEGEDSTQPDERIAAWQVEIDAALRRERDFRKDGRWLVQVYEGQLREEIPFNILYSNTETLSPALYNNTPRPVVKPRYKSNDSAPKASADLTSAYLEFFVDTGDAEAHPFDSLITAALHEALVPGRGQTRFCYDADIEYDSDKKAKRIKQEGVTGSHVPYDHFCHGYAKTWGKVPWVDFMHYMTEDEFKDRFPDWKGDIPTLSSRESDQESGVSQVEGAEGVKLVLVHEVWDKSDRKVLFFPEGAKEFAEESEDEYKLAGFFPCPRPMSFVTKIHSMAPTALYKLYENQARELNRITNRITVITAAIKAVGFYNPLIQGVDKVLELEDGQLHPMEGLTALGDGAALQNAIWMWPVEKLIVVLQTLMEQREKIKQVIYEITGISDILRGQSVASETATAQQIKNQWGGLRVKRLQKEVARFVKDCLRIAAELAFSKLGKDTLLKATATTLPRQEDWDAAKKRVDAVQAQAQAQAQMQSPSGPPMPGAPPPQAAPPPQPDPNDLALLNQPIFEVILKGLKDDLNRKYLIDIELNSTVDVEATEDKANLTDFLGAMAQFFAGVGPLVENGTLPWTAAKQMMLTISRKFRLGRDLDDELSAMVQPAPQGGAGQKAMAEAQALMQKAQAAQAAADKSMAEVQMQKREAQMGMKVQSLQSSMKQQGEAMQAALRAAQQDTKDVKTKAAIETLLKDLESKHTIMQADAMGAGDQMAADHAQRMLEMERAQSRLDETHSNIQHTMDKASMTLDHKKQQAAAAAKPKPKAGAK